MRRWVFLFFLVFSPLLTGCGGSYTYIYYEVVHSPAQVKPGDQVRVLLRNASSVQGTLVRAERGRVTVAVEGRGEQTFAWEEIRVLERVQRTKAK